MTQPVSGLSKSHQLPFWNQQFLILREEDAKEEPVNNCTKAAPTTLITEHDDKKSHGGSTKEDLKTDNILELQKIYEAIDAIKIEISVHELALLRAKARERDLEERKSYYQKHLETSEDAIYFNHNNEATFQQEIKKTEEVIVEMTKIYYLNKRLDYVSRFEEILRDFVENKEILCMDIKPLEPKQKKVIMLICRMLGLDAAGTGGKKSEILRIRKLKKFLKSSPNIPELFKKFKEYFEGKDSKKSCIYCESGDEITFKQSITFKIESTFKSNTFSDRTVFLNVCTNHRAAIIDIGCRKYKLGARCYGAANSRHLVMMKNKKSDGAYLAHKVTDISLSDPTEVGADTTSNETRTDQGSIVTRTDEVAKETVQEKVKVIHWKKAKGGYIKAGSVLWKNVKPLDAENVGYQLLLKGGWEPGKGLGSGELSPVDHGPMIYPGKNRSGIGHGFKKGCVEKDEKSVEKDER